MWIRSQDKTSLVDCNGFSFFKTDTDRFILTNNNGNALGLKVGDKIKRIRS